MVRQTNPDTEDCGCAFIIKDGVPTVECPTNEAQAMAFAVLQRNPDVSITVVATIVSAEDDDDLGADEQSDFNEDLEFDDVEEEEDDDDSLPF